MDYKTLIDRLTRRGLFRIHPSLDHVRDVLKALGQPQEGIPVIHIAGTNGKGSVAACLESVLRHAGYRTGLYLSPHLQDLRERIQINNLPISITRFWQLAQRILDTEQQTGSTLTYFEFLTAIAFLAFSEEKVDVIVLETGMGGRWDATNVVSKPLLTIITSIGMDHTQWLGRTILAITREKAGIIKSGSPLLLGVRGLPAKVLSKLAQKAHVPVYQIDQDFRAKTLETNWKEDFQQIEFQWMKGARREVPLALLGTFQVDNVALVLAGVELLKQSGKRIADNAVTQGLSNVKWPGRFQQARLTQGTTLLFDGAHNPDAMKCFLESVDQSPWKKTPKTFVFSAYQDKDYRQMLSLISKQANFLVLCTLPGSRSLSARKIKTSLAKSRVPVTIVADPHKALHQAIEITPTHHLIIVTGSVALVGMLLGDVVAEHRIEPKLSQRSEKDVSQLRVEPQTSQTHV